MNIRKNNDSLLDEALKKIDFESAINTHVGFERSDDPPQNVVLKIKKVFGPKRTPNQSNPPFPYEKNIFSLERKEIQKWQVDRGEKLLQYLNKELNQIDEIVQANSSAISNSSKFDQRRHFYYLALLSIFNLPQDVALKKLETLIAIKKILLNRYLCEENIEMAAPDKACVIRGCPHLAIHGSDYCAWHILNDPRQQLFVKCNICGWPRLGPCLQCNCHNDQI